jgi:TRAP-type mannitol/chloroaromatic compound transport system permease small subunit
MLQGISRFLARLGGGMILLTTIPIAGDVLLRKLFGQSWLESYELTIYAFAIAVALGYGYALTSASFIRIDVLHSRLPRRLRVLLDLAAMLLLCTMVGLLLWHGAQTLQQSIAMGARSNSAFGVRLAIPQSLWILGFLWFFVVSISLTLRMAYEIGRGHLEQAERILSAGKSTELSEAEMKIVLQGKTAGATPSVGPV